MKLINIVGAEGEGREAKRRVGKRKTKEMKK